MCAIVKVCYAKKVYLKQCLFNFKCLFKCMEIVLLQSIDIKKKSLIIWTAFKTILRLLLPTLLTIF